MKEEYTMQNAVIISTDIRIERGFAVCAWVHLGYDNGGQGFGGNVLLNISDLSPKEKVTANYGIDYIARIMTTIEVESWNDLVGKSCRVMQTSSHVLAIGHYLKNQWFNIEEWRAKWGFGK
jgi:hypothetical protein